MKHTRHLILLLLLMLLAPLAGLHAVAEYPAGFSAHGTWGGSGMTGADPEVLSVRGTKPGDYVIWKPALNGPAKVKVSVYGLIEGGIPVKQRYELHHQGKVTPVEVEFTVKSGWVTLGNFPFDGNGKEYLRLFAVLPGGVRAAEAKFGIFSEAGNRVVRTIVISQGTPRTEVPPKPRPSGVTGLPAPTPKAVAPITSLWLAPHVSDSMVVQRGKPVVIVGRAPQDTEVTVSLAGKTCTTTGGEFKVVLPALEAGGPYELRVCCGKEEKVVKEVMVGDIWMIAGQSNMAFGVGGLDNAKEILADANYPGIRYFDGGGSGRWTVASSKTAAKFSAVGYLMARRLHKELKVSIGLIHPAGVGGDVRGFVRDEELIKLEPKVPFIAGGPNRRSLFSHEAATLIGFPVTGFLYYQGEGNSWTPLRHRDMLPALARDVRGMWGQGNFPFIYVQLPRYAPTFVAMREAQLLAQADIPNSAMVVSIDTGMKDLVHPGDKRLIGERAASAALALAYGVTGEYTGPMFAESSMRDGSIFAKFEHTGTGLESHGALDGFEVCGADDLFKPAKAEIVGPDTVRIWSGDVKEPKAARYLWSGFPERVSLYNKEGFTASPFWTNPLDTDRVFDNRDSSFLVRGEWQAQTGNPQAFGPDFLLDATRENDGESNWLPWAKWMLSTVRTGNYGIYLRWPAGRPATATAEVKVIGAEVYPPVSISQAGSCGDWQKIGTFRLFYGDANSVKLITAGAGVAVDAMKIVLEHE